MQFLIFIRNCHIQQKTTPDFVGSGGGNTLNWHKKHLIKMAQHDLIAIEPWNKRAVDSLKKDGIMRTYGIAPKGPKKGKECVCLTDNWNTIVKEINSERKRTCRFWLEIFLGGLFALIAAVAGPFLVEWIKSLC